MTTEPGDVEGAKVAVEARFDDVLHAWVLTRYADVSAALRDPHLSVAGTGDEADAAHLAVREAAARALSPARLAEWRGEMEAGARVLVERLPAEVPVDLVTEFARPWAVGLAIRVTGAPPVDSERLDGLARDAFLAAACATDSGVQPVAQAAVAELARSLPADGASADVQTFVALSQTLPCFLGGAWHELFRNRDEADRLRAHPELMPAAVEELLRHAGPSRAIFRRASGPTSIGNARIGAGDCVILMLWAANHDPAQFPEQDRLDLCRDVSAHLAFGRGAHSCSGAPLIRLAVAVATEALLNTTTAVELIGDVEWVGGFAIRGPASLPVVLQRNGPS